MGRRSIAVSFAALLLSCVPARPGPPLPPGGNGTIGVIAGEGGDPALGLHLYAARCASCHDHAVGRAPSRAALAGETRAAITATLTDGIMRPMAEGLSLHEKASVAAFLSNRQGGGVGALGWDMLRCTTKPPPIDLASHNQWNGWGRTADQGRFQPDPGLTVADIPRLKLKWVFAYPNSRNGQATLIGNRLFLNSSSGAVYALDARTGCAYWRFDAPAASRGSIIVGPRPGRPGDAVLYLTDYTRSVDALDADSGALLFKTQVDDQQEVQMTGSPALADGLLFVPISSAEEAIAENPNYSCCRFRGAVAAVDAATGRLLWKTYVAPAARPFRRNAQGVQMYGPAGGAIWSAPTVDPVRHLVYVATGDSYTDVAMPNSDAVLALDERTGAIRWSRQLTRGDDFIEGCDGPYRGANCPTDPGPDFDFGASPILRTLPAGRTLLLAGQKSGVVYALDPDSGRVVWSTHLSPGGPLGGVEFGMAADGDRLFVPISDIYVPRSRARPGLSALRISDGAVLWHTTTPRLPCAWQNVYCGPAMSQAVTAIPGAVFGASMDGRLRAFDASDGHVLWTAETGVSVTTVAGRTASGGVMDGAGPTIAGGTLYVNSGYWGRSGNPGTVLMAFTLR